MKKFFIILASVAAAVLMNTACTQDLTGIEDRLESLEERVAAMVLSVNALNDNVKALQAFAESGQTVKSITSNGNVYTITLGNNEEYKITVENKLNVSIDKDGYWTVDGKQILYDGKPVSAVGKPGEDGAAGEPGKTPIFGVDEDGYWTVKYDEAEEAKRITDVNGDPVYAQGSPEGDSVFKSVAVEDGYLVIVLNSDPEKTYRLPIEADFRIEVAADCVAVVPGATVEIPFEIKGKDESTRVFVEAQGYTAVLKESAIAVTAPADLPEDGYVIIKAIRNSDSSMKALYLSFEQGVLSYVLDTEILPKTAGEVKITVKSNLEYTVNIPAEASWIHLVPATKAVTESVVTLAVDANEGARRTAKITLVPSIGEAQTVAIVQAGEGEEVFVKVDLSIVAGFNVAGSAIGTPAAMTQTLENEDVFAFYNELKAGEMYIEMLGEDASLGAIIPAKEELVFAEAAAFEQNFVGKGAWTIPADGKYRIVLNRKDGVITIYDEANDLQPVVIKWRPNGDESVSEQETVVEKVFLRGEPAGWSNSGKDIGFAPSLADPQILVCRSEWTWGGRTSFAIYKGGEIDGKTYTINNSYVFTCEFKDDGSQQDVVLPLDTWMPIIGGVIKERGNYFNLQKPKFFILDLRNMKIFTSAN
ncbi:MAG: PL29 family lyase N-terminal domain-containing protein [Candidatus Cryptobacteroides sp.]